jgi:hypothetical protein
MISMLRLLLPIALVAYCVCRASRHPIFLFGIPFLQVMQHSLFLDKVKLFWVPGRWDDSYHVLVWMLLAWVWCVYASAEKERPFWLASRRPLASRLPEEYLVLALAILVLGKLMWAAGGRADTNTMLSQFGTWAMLPVGYWLLRSAVLRSSPEDVAALLRAIAVATGIGSALFILHQGLGIHIYDTPEHSVVVFGGKLLTRTFWFMPPFLALPLAMAFARRSWNALGISFGVLTFVAVVVSYTRIYLLEAVAVLAALLALHLFKERRVSALVRRLSMLGAVLAFVLLILLVALPTSTNYFLSRMATLTSASRTVEDPDVQVRQARLGMLAETVSSRYMLAGAPFGASDEFTASVDSWTSDSTWVGVLYWTGYAGVALVGGMFVLFALRAFVLFLRLEGTAEFLGAVLFASIVGMFVATFASWTFLREWGHPLGFWLFAFVAGEAERRRQGSAVKRPSRRGMAGV